MVVEVSMNGLKKYAYDSEMDAIKLNRVLYDGLKFPFNYGFVPQTEGRDGDHLDAFIISTHPITRSTVVQCRAIGVLEITDHGKHDPKIIAIPISENRFKNIQDIGDLPLADKDKLLNFYEQAGLQWDREMKAEGFSDKAKARKELLRTQI